MRCDADGTPSSIPVSLPATLEPIAIGGAASTGGIVRPPTLPSSLSFPAESGIPATALAGTAVPDLSALFDAQSSRTFDAASIIAQLPAAPWAKPPNTANDPFAGATAPPALQPPTLQVQSNPFGSTCVRVVLCVWEIACTDQLNRLFVRMMCAVPQPYNR